MKDSAKYVKIVEWSEEDQCYVGNAPGLILEVATGVTKRKYLMSYAKPSRWQLNCIEMTESLYPRQLLGVTLPPRCRM